jgi:hypothetical protein
MFIQTVIQTLLRKRKKAESSKNPIPPKSEKELSPMAKRIMQKLAEHEKKAAQTLKKDTSADNKAEDKSVR